MTGIREWKDDFKSPLDAELRTYRVFSETDKNEVSLLRDLQRCIAEGIITDRNHQKFLQLAARINDLFQDEIERKHNSRITTLYQNMGPQHCPKIEQKKGFEKEAAKLHCIYEVLKLKFDLRRSLEDTILISPTFELYKYSLAHEEAITAEKFLYLAKAKEMKLPLSMNALNFIDLAHEPWTLDFYLNLRHPNWKNTIESLLSRWKSPPNISELKDLIRFMKESGSWDSCETTPEQYVWRKFLFIEIYKQHAERGRAYIDAALMLLAWLEKEGKLSLLEPEFLLRGLMLFLKELECTLSSELGKGEICVYRFLFLGKPITIGSFFTELQILISGRPPSIRKRESLISVFKKFIETGLNLRKVNLELTEQSSSILL